MKKVIIILIYLSIIFIGGCDMAGASNDKHPEKTYKIIEIDSCEYIYISRRPWGSTMAIAHKGNCKYCKQRRETE